MKFSFGATREWVEWVEGVRNLKHLMNAFKSRWSSNKLSPANFPDSRKCWALQKVYRDRDRRLRCYPCSRSLPWIWSCRRESLWECRWFDRDACERIWVSSPTLACCWENSCIVPIKVQTHRRPARWARAMPPRFYGLLLFGWIQWTLAPAACRSVRRSTRRCLLSIRSRDGAEIDEMRNYVRNFLCLLNFHRAHALEL